MIPVIMKTTQKAVELVVALALLALGVVIFFEGLRLGPGFGPPGPAPGFFPFALTILMMIGIAGVIYAALRSSDTRAFFEDRREIVDLVQVGVPVIVAMASVRWLGLYIMAGIFIGLFSWWYDRFRWWQGLAAAIITPVVLYILFRYGFGLPMPRSVFFGQDILGIRVMI